MKKILVSILLFVFGVCLVGCVDTPNGPGSEDPYLNGKYKLTVIDDFGYLVEPLDNYYKDGEEVEVHLAFLSGPSVGININGDYIGEDAETKHVDGHPVISFIMPNRDSILYTTMNGLILRDCGEDNHQWDEGVVDPSSSLSTPPIIYTCMLCGTTKKEPSELLEHEHNYIDGLCECGEFDISWLNEHFRLSDEQILFKGSVDDEFNCDVILLTLKHTTTYIELSKRYFKIDNISKVEYLGGARPPEYFFEEEYKHLLEPYNQIVFLHVSVECKEEIIELIKELEKLPFIRSANYNMILHGD